MKKIALIILALVILFSHHALAGSFTYPHITTTYVQNYDTLIITDSSTTIVVYGVATTVFVNPSPTTYVTTVTGSQTYNVTATVYTTYIFVPDSWTHVTDNTYVTTFTKTNIFTITFGQAWSSVYYREHFTVIETITIYGVQYYTNSGFLNTIITIGSIITVSISDALTVFQYFDTNEYRPSTINAGIVTATASKTSTVFGTVVFFKSNPITDPSGWTQTWNDFYVMYLTHTTFTVYNAVLYHTVLSKVIFTMFFYLRGKYTGEYSINYTTTVTDKNYTDWALVIHDSSTSITHFGSWFRSIIQFTPPTTSVNSIATLTVYINGVGGFTFTTNSELPSSLVIKTSSKIISTTSNSIIIVYTYYYSPTNNLTLTFEYESFLSGGTLFPSGTMYFVFDKHRFYYVSVVTTTITVTPIEVSINTTFTTSGLTVIVTDSTTILIFSNKTTSKIISGPFYFRYSKTGIWPNVFYLIFQTRVSTIPTGWFMYNSSKYWTSTRIYVTLNPGLWYSHKVYDTFIFFIEIYTTALFSPPPSVIINGYPVIDTYSSNGTLVTVNISKTSTRITIGYETIMSMGQDVSIMYSDGSTVIISTDITVKRSGVNIIPTTYTHGTDGNYTFLTTFDETFVIVNGDHSGTVIATETLIVKGKYTDVILMNPYTMTTFEIVDRLVGMTYYFFLSSILIILFVSSLLYVYTRKDRYKKMIIYATIAIIIVTLTPKVLEYLF